jgi:hypothetical protein
MCVVISNLKYCSLEHKRCLDYSDKTHNSCCKFIFEIEELKLVSNIKLLRWLNTTIPTTVGILQTSLTFYFKEIVSGTFSSLMPNYSKKKKIAPL